MPQVTFKIEKQAPVISVSNGSSENLELFHGIGNTLGFNITGGFDFSMPITIFHVKEGSRAENSGLKLGDSIVTINGKDTSDMTLQEANNVLEQAAQQDVKLGVIKFDEVDEANASKKPSVHNVILQGKRKNRLPFEEELCVPRAREKSLAPGYVADARVRQTKRIPTGSINVELVVKSMQRQLLQIADKIPDDIMLTLLKSFAKILSREPEPAPKPAPFIRAFAKIRDDGTFANSSEDEEDRFKDYDSGNEVETFNFKVTTKTEEFAYAAGESSEQLASIEEVCEIEPANGDILENGFEVLEIPENSENVDEGIEVEMPKLLPTDDETIDQEATNEDPTAAFNEIAENSVENPENLENENLEIQPETIVEEEQPPVEEEPEIEEEPIPVEPPKVSLDDIQREIEEMSFFLKKKGLDVEKKKKKKNEQQPEINGNADENDPKTIEDAYQVDVCIKLKNREHKHREHKHREHKHHHSKYMRSEGYKEEIINDGPIFDPTIPNTQEDFMKVKSVPEKSHKKPKKGTQAFDVSWQNVLESQKKHYKHSDYVFEKTKKNVAEQQQNIKFN